MKNCNILEEILPYPMEGDGDGVIDLDSLLGTGVGSDRDTPPVEGETEEEKAARLAAEEAAKKGGEGEGEGEGGEGDADNLTLLQGLSSDDISDDEKEFKKEILEKFKGESIDDEGNILDKDGNVVANFEEVDKFINAEPIFDKDGNQVDEEGKVLKTKAQVEFEKSAIGGVIAELPYELVDEKGDPIVYEDTLEGYTKLAKDIANVELENYKQSFFNSHPTLREVSKHLLSGGKLEDFNNPIDYKAIDTKTLSNNDKLDLIKESYIASGVDKDSAADMIDLIKEKGDAEIDKRLTKAISTLDSAQQESQKARDAAYQKSIDDANNRIIQYWGQVKQTLDKGKLGNLDIPKDEQEAFFKYISTPIDEDGNSQETLDNNEEGLEADLMMRYYRFKKYNLSRIVESEKNKDKIKSLRERINKARKSNSQGGKSTTTPKQGNPGDVSLDVLLES